VPSTLANGLTCYLDAMGAPKSTKSQPDVPRTRRTRGEPRRLLLKAAAAAFNEKGYVGTSTREIAERAEVSETLMFRYFGSKAELFRVSMVAPFVEFVDGFVASRSGQNLGSGDTEEIAQEFIGQLYDIFSSHRALAAMLLAADVHTESELAATGVLDDVRSRIEMLVQLGEAEMKARGQIVRNPALTTRTTIALIAGMATFGSWFFGRRRPSRAAILNELTQTIIYGRQRPPQ
jgi:AcrR family transcriptional regulator